MATPYISDDPVAQPFISDDPVVSGGPPLSALDTLRKRRESQTDPLALASGFAGGLGHLAGQGLGVAKELVTPNQLFPGQRALAEGILRGAANTGEMGRDAFQEQIQTPWDIVKRAFQEQGTGAALKQAALRAPALLAQARFSPVSTLLEPRALTMSTLFPKQAEEVAAEQLKREQDQAADREAVALGKRSLTGEAATALADAAGLPSQVAMDVGKLVAPPPGMENTIGITEQLADPTLPAGFLAKPAALAGRAARLARAARAGEKVIGAAAEVGPRVRGIPPTPQEHILDELSARYSRAVQEAAAPSPAAATANQALTAAGDTLHEAGTAVAEQATVLDDFVERNKRPLRVLGSLGGMLIGPKGAVAGTILPDAAQMGLTAAERASQAGGTLRALGRIDWDSSRPAWQQLAKDPAAPAWLRRGVSMPVYGSLTVGQVAESGAKAGIDVARGAAHGGAVGLGMAAAGPNKGGEELGAALGQGMAIGGVGAAAAAPRMARERARVAYGYDAMTKAAQMLQSGTDAVAVALTPDHVMASAVILEGLFRGALPGGRGLRVDLVDPEQFAAQHQTVYGRPAPENGVAFAAPPVGEEPGRLVINVAANDPQGRMLHEAGHALFESVVAASPNIVQHFERLLGPGGLERAKAEYGAALGGTEGAVAAAAPDNNRIVGELFSEALADLMREGNLQRAIPGLERSVMQTFFSDPEILKALRDPSTRQLVLGQFEGLRDFLPGIDEATERGVRLEPQDVGRHPALTRESDFVAVTPDGRAIPAPPAVVKRRVASRRQEMREVFGDRSNPLPAGMPDPQVQARLTPSGLVQITGTRLGDRFYTDVVSFGPATKEMLRGIETAIASGQTLAGWYQQIGDSPNWAPSVRERLGAIEAQFKDFVPFAFRVDNQGNLLVQNYSLTAFHRKANAWALRTGKPLSLDLWGGDISKFVQDAQTYLRNHADGQPGATGIGEAKRNLINVFLVGGNRTFEALNPLRVHARGDDRVGIIRSYRADRLQTVEPSALTGFTRPEHALQVQNFSPAVEETLSEGTKRVRTKSPAKVKAEFEAAKESLGSLEGVSGGSPAKPVVTPLVSRIRTDLDYKPVNPIGMLAATAEDRHAVASLFRNPAFEAFRWVFTKDGKVAAVANVTVREPNTTHLWAPDLDANAVQKIAQSVGADSYFWVHNHPSGDSSPSAADIHTTQGWFRKINELRAEGPGGLSDLTFLGHIVVDHTQHRYIAPGSGKVDTIPTKGQSPDPLIRDPIWPRPIRSPIDMAEMAQALASGKASATALFADTRGFVRAIGEVDHTAAPALLHAEMRKMAKAVGAIRAFGYYPAGPESLRAAELAVRQGAFLDAYVEGQPKSVRESLADPLPYKDLTAGQIHPSQFESQAVTRPDQTLNFSAKVEPKQVSFNADEHALAIEKSARDLDSLADKSLTQVALTTTKYAKPLDPESIVLPPRLGLVNRNIVGMPRSFSEVSKLIVSLVHRLEHVVKTDPEFARESARFYSDMADSALILADISKPNSTRPDQYKVAELMLRYLALGSPRTGVSANATKSSGSASAFASGFTPGRKIGYVSQQLGARDTTKGWFSGEPFDMTGSGVDNKVRNFYLNGLAELIERSKNDSLLAPESNVEHFLLERAATAMGELKKGETLTPDMIPEVRRLLDGFATVDMWDMAAKGYARPGFIPNRKERSAVEQPWGWSDDRYASVRPLATIWRRIAKELSDSPGKKNGRQVVTPADLRYQEARSLQIDGKKDWNAESWEERRAQPFPPETPMTVFTTNSEEGLSPGGTGPLYDAHQAIDGMLADELNRLGLAPLFGKDKLSARNAQEILWALERKDNPIKSMNDLSLFGHSIKSLGEQLEALRAGGKISAKSRGAAVLTKMLEGYADMANQDIPIEAITSGTSEQAKAIQTKISELQAAGVRNPEAHLTAHIANGLPEVVTRLADDHGVHLTVDSVRTDIGGFSSGDQYFVSPNMVLRVRGEPTAVKDLLRAMSMAMDQESGNVFRKPTIKELHDPATRYNTVLFFDTKGMSDEKRTDFFRDLASVKDGEGNSFLTGFTSTPDGSLVGDQFYGPRMWEEYKRRADQIDPILIKHGVPSARAENLIIETVSRSDTPDSRFEKSPFTQAIRAEIQRRVSAASPEASVPTAFPQHIDEVARVFRLADLMQKTPVKSEATRKQFFTRLKSSIDAAVLRDKVTPNEGEALKDRLSGIEKGIAAALAPPPRLKRNQTSLP